MNHLHVFDSCIDRGLIYHTPRGEHTPFIKVPQKTALIMTDMTNVNLSNNLVNALDLACHFQKGKNPHGKTKVTHIQSKLCCIGTKVNRTSTGVPSHSHHIKKMPSSAWDTIVSYMTKVKKIYTSYINTDEIHCINHTRDVVPFKTATSLESPIGSPGNCRFVSGLSFVRNCYLNVHRYHDFSYSVAMVHIDQYLYGYASKLVAYMCHCNASW